MLTLCIQAGGKSSRMGTDKALLDFSGVPLIQHLITRLGTLADEVIITTNQPENYPFLELPLIPDIIPDRGALGGLYTALHAAAHPFVAVVACDLPFASTRILQACYQLLQTDPHLDAIIPKTTQGLEPLHAVYRRATCLPPVKDAIDAGKWKMVCWHQEVKIKTLTPEETAPLDPTGLAFSNINTPEDLAAARRIHRQQSSR